MVDMFGEQLNTTLENMLDASGIGWGKPRHSEDSGTMSLVLDSDDSEDDYMSISMIDTPTWW